MENSEELKAVEKQPDETPPNSVNKMMSRLKISPEKIKLGLVILAVIAIISGLAYWYVISQRVYSDKAEIYTPLIGLSPVQPGVLDKILVEEGQQVSANQAVAQLSGGDVIRAKTDGIVVSQNDQVGKLFTPGTPVVTMINPDDMRVIVHVAENKGLNSVHAGQKVIFTVDAFGAKEFTGTVEDISATSDVSSVVFSISDKRDEKFYSVKVKYSGYPELLNGMSAKAWIYK